MKKKIIGFYDLCLYAIFCGPMIVAAVVLTFIVLTRGTHEWIYSNMHLVCIMAVTTVLPLRIPALLRYCEFNNDAIHFQYCIIMTNWEKLDMSNIDLCWNQDMFISEIANVEIVELTEEEKQTKVYFKHRGNKYFKVNLIHGKSKYVYVGNYSNRQIKKIVKYAKTTFVDSEAAKN
jgi:hypothetical protein